MPDFTNPYSLDLNETSPSASGWAMMTGEIPALQQTVSIPCTGEIVSVGSEGGIVPCSGEIVHEAPEVPENPLGMHLNQGRIVVTWEHPSPHRVDYFEVYAGMTSGGPYYPYPTGRIAGLTGFLTNAPLGTTLYLQVRAVGKNRLASAFVSIQRAVFQPIEGLLQVRGVSGSQITENAHFSVWNPDLGGPITFRAAELIVLP